MQYAPGLDIVVVGHKTPDELSACLCSIGANLPTIPHTVTVVHSAPDDADLKAAEQPTEVNGPARPDPARYGDWENKGIASDF